MATDIAAELTQRIRPSGPFLEIAVLHAEARFLQEYRLNPMRLSRPRLIESHLSACAIVLVV